MASDDAANERPSSDETLLFRLPKKQLAVRTASPVAGLLDHLGHRAGDCGCGDVSRDELVAALIVAAHHADDDELRRAVEAFRQARVGDLSTPGQPAEAPA